MPPEAPLSGSGPGFFRVGDFLVRPSLKTVSRFSGFEDLSAADAPSRLHDKAMAVLVLLAENPKQVCARDFLLDTVWGPDREAFDRVLDNAVSEIRRAFGDKPRNSSYVETIPKQGYRLIAEVEWPGSESQEATGSEGPTPSSGSSEPDPSPRTDSGSPVEPPVLGRPPLSWAGLRGSGVYGLLFLLLVLSALWAFFGRDPGYRIHIHPIDNRTHFDSFDDFGSKLTQELASIEDCGRAHVVVRELAFMSNIAVTPILELRGMDALLLSLDFDGAEDNSGSPEPLLIGNDSGAEALAPRTARAVGAYFDRLLCSRETMEGEHRARHCHDAGTWLRGQERYSEAMHYLELAIETEPRFFDAYDAMANIKHILGQDPEAETYLKTALGLAPPPTVRRALERRLAQVNGNYAKEKKLLEEIHRESGNAFSAQALGWWLLTHERNCRDSEDLFRDALRLEGGEAPILHAYLGEAQLRCRDREAAVVNYERYAEEDPYNPNAHVLLAELLRLLGREAEAKDHLRTALSLDPRHFDARFQQAMIHRDLGELDKAEGLLRELLTEANSPNASAELRGRLAEIALRRGDPHRALELADRAAEDKSDAVLALWMRGLAHIAIAENSTGIGTVDSGTGGDDPNGSRTQELEAVEVILLRIDGMRADKGTAWQMELRHYLLGRLSLSSGHPLAAIEAFLQALELFPADQAFFHHGLAEARIEAGHHSKALDSLWDALAFNPNHLPSLCTAAALELRSGNTEQASEHYERAWTLAGPKPEDHTLRQCLDARRLLQSAPSGR